jgi:hypothetical protein
LDLWYKLDAWRGRRIRLAATVGVLSKGEVGLATPYETYYSSSHDAPTGTAERELRLRGEGEYRWDHGVAAHAGLGWQTFWNRDHLEGEDISRFQLSAGIAWSLFH